MGNRVDQVPADGGHDRSRPGVHNGPRWSAGLADAGTGPIPVAGRDAAGRGDPPGRDDPASTTAPQRVPQAWPAPPDAAPGFAPASRAYPPGGGPFPPPRAAGSGPAGPPRGATAPGTGAGPAAVQPPAAAPAAAPGTGATPQAPGFGGPAPYGRRPLPPPQRPLRRCGRNAAVVAFVLHQFPIGHMPVAASRASMQLSAPAQESDGFTGLRFPPQDHPQSSLIDDADAVARMQSGALTRKAAAEGASVPDEVVAAHEPFGGLSERDWEHEYLARQPAGERAEYAWPPAASFPEGGTGPGEALVLEPGTVVDRIGADSGRILAPEGTLFARRSLPPDYREREFRRYRVLRRLPVWQAVNAPWFAQPGGAVRYRTTAAVADLVGLGYLVELMATGEPVEEPTVRIKDSSGEARGEQ